MSLFYRAAYRLGFTPWESGLAQARVAAWIAAMFDREQAGRSPPYGGALDLGCGSGIHAVELARRGWQVTGVDNVATALEAARARARDAGVEVRFQQGDVTALGTMGIGSDFRLVLDFGTVHGLTDSERATMGREVNAVTAADATLLMFAFAPGRRGPLPRGLGAADIEATYPGWRITDDVPQDAELPWFLARLGADPHWYRLRRGQASEPARSNESVGPAHP